MAALRPLINSEVMDQNRTVNIVLFFTSPSVVRRVRDGVERVLGWPNNRSALTDVTAVN